MNRLFVFLIVCFAVSVGCSKKQNVQDVDVPINAKGDIEGHAFTAVENWFTKDSEKNGVEGTSVDRAYVEIPLTTTSEPIIVAVIDSGIDIDHEDLQGRLWVNPGEIPNNRLDDDGNGYVDDVHGWNFLGGYDAEGNVVNLGPTTLEMTRELVRMKRLKGDKEAEGKTLSDSEQAYLDQLTSDVETERQKPL